MPCVQGRYKNNKADVSAHKGDSRADIRAAPAAPRASRLLVLPRVDPRQSAPAPRAPFRVPGHQTLAPARRMRPAPPCETASRERARATNRGRPLIASRMPRGGAGPLAGSGGGVAAAAIESQSRFHTVDFRWAL